MIFREMRYYFRYLVTAVALMAGVVSCVNDNLSDVPSSGDEIFNTDGFSLGFTVSLESISGTGTRAVDDSNAQGSDLEAYENFIDTENGFRVLFFDANGQFIFEAIDRTVMPREVNGREEWFVHIPVNYIIDYEGDAYDIEALKTQLKEKDFKIAILANWPYRNSNNGETVLLSNAEPKWGLKNSILYSGADRVQKNINDLHHLTRDSGYSNASNGNSDNKRPSSSDTYGFIMEGDKMGIKSDWVKSLWSSQEDAENFIKSNWDPTRAGAAQYKHYHYMWYLWNFSAAYKVSGTRFSDNDVSKGGDNALGWKWVRKNHYDKRDTDHPLVGYHSENSPLYDFMQGTSNSFVDNSDDAGLTFDLNQYTGAKIVDYSGNNANPKNPDYAQWGIQLPAITSGNQSKDSPKGIKITVSATGKLRILCSNRNTSNDARIAVYNQSNNGSGNCTLVDNPSTNMIPKNTTTPIYVERSISITGDTEDHYIYCNSGSTVEIFEIEYVKSKHLYDTDRNGVMPSSDQPIPMYGVQNFKALGDSWGSGSTFDLSHQRDPNDENSQEKLIYLIRSVAKVEVYLPKSYNGNPLKHVYMRSINRTARCEPVDVETPLDLNKWNNDEHPDLNGNSYGSYTGSCEWYTIQAHGPFYQTPGTGESKDISSAASNRAYRDKLAWFYGSWASAKWSDGKGWNFGTNVTQPSSGNYPHLFNSCIDRSDFTRMIKDIGYNNSYFDRYILYVPDKNIDDPNHIGVPHSITKVAHVEYRYDNPNDDFDDLNLDDNNCYRIYFTNYGGGGYRYGYKQNTSIGDVKKGEFDNGYELSADNLSFHWPIMRNHRYVFVVNGTYSRSGEDGGTPQVTSMVTTWSGEPLEDEHSLE